MSGRADAARPGRRLAGRTAIVTGAERGIGRAIALGYAAAGANVAIFYVDSSVDAEAVVAEARAAGVRATAVRADLAHASEIKRAYADVRANLGTPDVLVNNAGILIRRPFFDTSLVDLDRTLAVDLQAPFLLSQLVAATLVEEGRGGSIVNVTSVSQERAAPGLVAYQAAKAGLWMLTRGLALELAPHGIRVNAIAPGTTETALNREALSDDEVAAQRLATIPLGRFGAPEDHVGAAIFYASDESSWITGSCLVVDGGITVR